MVTKQKERGRERGNRYISIFPSPQSRGCLSIKKWASSIYFSPRLPRPSWQQPLPLRRVFQFSDIFAALKFGENVWQPRVVGRFNIFGYFYTYESWTHSFGFVAVTFSTVSALFGIKTFSSCATFDSVVVPWVKSRNSFLVGINVRSEMAWPPFGLVKFLPKFSMQDSSSLF